LLTRRAWRRRLGPGRLRRGLRGSYPLVEAGYLLAGLREFLVSELPVEVKAICLLSKSLELLRAIPFELDLPGLGLRLLGRASDCLLDFVEEAHDAPPGSMLSLPYQ
jgi:hypothetical protein